MAIVEQGEYKGNAMLILRRNEQDKFPFQFGLAKAKLILECLPDIQEFVESHSEVGQ